MQLQNIEDEEVVISGIGCKLPESETMEEFAEKLFSGQNMVTRDDRKLSQGLFENLPEYSGKIRDTRKFDYTFFGISNIVVQCMDPMTQQIMERTFEAVLDAGINPSELRGSDTAVFSGTSISDFDLEWATNYRGGYGIMGRNRCMNANRVSYWLDLKGTSVSVDSAWANGITNIRNGWDAIRQGRCDTAIVSTANLQSNAEITIQLNDLGFLSPSGECRSFDDSANGYTRSDAVVVFVLQRASIARRSYASIAHVYAKCYGDRDNVIHRPLEEHWEDIFNEFYAESKIDVNDISYLEGHGSGIKYEDTVELNAITNFFCRKRKTPLLIGSVKSNMGHAEASAASCGLIKAIISLEKGIIPQNLNFTSPNSDASQAFQSGKLKLVERNTPISENGLIAINSHGFGGIYAHIVLRRNMKQKVKHFDGIPRLVLVAGRTNDLMDNVMAKLESMPFDEEYISLLNKICSKKVDKYLGRGYTILPKKESGVVHDHQVYNEMKRPVWFIFSGMGSQWPTMGKRLMCLPIFRESIERSHKVLEGKGLDLIKIITDDDPKMFENILHSFVGIAAVQIALVDILNALQIVPDGMIGHSVGELGCAYADGCFTAEQMILSAYSRGRASLESNLIKGYMAAVGMGYNQIKDELPEGIEVACHNAADSCTISGPADLVQEYVKVLDGRKIFARTVNVSNIAYHSRYIKPAAPRLLKYLKEVIPKPKLRSSRWITTSNTEDKWDTELAKYCSAEYHTNNLLSSVLFEEGCRHIPSDAICIEIAPHGLLQAILKRSLGENCTNISLTHRTAEDPFMFLLQAIGKLFMAGLEPQIANIYPKVEYPVSRATPSIHQLIYWDHEVDLTEAQTRAEKKVIYSFKSHFLKFAPDGIGYIINEENTYPVAVFLHLVWSIFASLKKKKTEDCPIVFENMRIECPVVIHPSKNDDGMITLQKGTGDFEINTTHLIARGNIQLLDQMPKCDEEDADDESSTAVYTMTKDEVYNEFQAKGYDVGESFKSLSSVDIGSKGWKGEIEEGANWVQILESLFQIQMLQVGEESLAPKFPKSFEKMYLNPIHHQKWESYTDEVRKNIANYNIIQNTISIGGVWMKGFQVQELPLSKSTLKFTHKLFVPFINPPFQDIRQYVDFCVGIVVDNSNWSGATENEVNMLEVKSDKAGVSLAAHIQEFMGTTKLKVQTVCGVSEVDPKKCFDMIICKQSESSACLPLLSEKGFLLVRCPKNQSLKFPNGTDVVSKFSAGEDLILIKKWRSNSEPEFVSIPKSEAILANILHSRTDTKPVCLIGHGEPERGIEGFKRRMHSETKAPLRWIFVLDEMSKQPEEAYKAQARNGLTTNVLCNGSWGFFLQRNCVEKQFDSELFNVTRLNREMVECRLGFDFSRNFVELEQVDFCGRLKNNTKIMGVGTVMNDKSIVRDKFFSWPLPDKWTLEDGVSVPLSYIFAYYCISLVGKTKRYEGLLITDACTPLGMAAVRVGLSVVKNVFATVASEEEVAMLRSFYPSLPRSNILIHEDKNFNINLGLMTKGRNPEVIINQLEKERFFSACNCLTSFGRIFHFGVEESKKNVQLGTSVFLLSTSFYSMSQEVITNLKDEEKRRLCELMEKGIKDGIVKPLPRKMFTSKELHKIVSNGAKVPRNEKIIVGLESATQDHGKLFVDSDSSYLVLGDESDVWADVMRCLIRKGARKIVVSYSGHTKRVERHSKIIKKHSVVLHEERNLPDVQSLVAEAQAMGPLSAVFVIGLKTRFSSKVMTEVDRVFRDKNGHLIAITREGGLSSEVCTRRNLSGYPSTNFIWGAEEILVGRELELMTKLSGRDPVFHVSHTLKSGLDSNNKERMLREVLPATVDDFCNLGASLSKEVRLVEMSTMMGRRSTELKELTPLIFIGGLRNDPEEVLRPLSKTLMYPVYCLHLPNMKLSIRNLVSFILPKIFELRTEGNVFNIVGISWGCYVAIEVAKQIEAIGGNVGLILIDCPHQNLRQSLIGNKSWDLDLINVIQGYSTTVDSDVLATDKTWSLKLNRIITTLGLTREREDDFRAAAIFIRNSFEALMDYEIAGTKLLGPLTVVKSGPQTSDDRTISRMCNCISVRSIPLSPTETITSKELREIIHGSAVTQSMSNSTIHFSSWRNLEDFLIQQKLSDFNSLTADFRVTATKLKFSFTH